MGINYMLGILYGDLQENIVIMVDGVAKRNPMLYSAFYMATLQLSDTYKFETIPFKLLELISNNVKDFKTKCAFKSEALKKVAFAIEDSCSEIFSDFLVIPFRLTPG